MSSTNRLRPINLVFSLLLILAIILIGLLAFQFALRTDDIFPKSFNIDHPVAAITLGVVFGNLSIGLIVFYYFKQRIRRQHFSNLAAIVNACPIPSAITASNGEILIVNPEFTRIFGYALADFSDVSNWQEKLFPEREYRQWIFENCTNKTCKVACADTAASACQINVHCRDGSIKSVAINHASIPDLCRTVNWSLFYNTSPFENCSDKSEYILRSIIETIPMRIFWKDRDSRYLGCNTAFAKDGGCETPQDIIGKLDSQLAWKNQAELYRTDDLAVINKGLSKINYEEPQTNSSGQQIWLRTSKVPLLNFRNEIIGVLGVYDDITDYKSVENELWIAKNFIDKSATAFFRLSTEGQFMYVNEAAGTLIGCHKDELIGLYPWDVDPDFPAAEWPAFWRALKVNKYANFESRVQRADGTLVSVEISGHYILYNNQEFNFVFVKSIEERKQMEKSLRDREKYLRTLLDNFPFMVWLKDVDGRFLAVNKVLANNFGFETPDEMIGKCDFDVTDLPQAEQFVADDKEVMATRRQKSMDEQIRIRNKRSWVETFKAPVISDNGDLLGTVGFARDVTERKQAEQMLLEAKTTAEKTATAKSEFLATMSHEIRTPLNGIIGLTELALNETLQPQARDYLFKIRSSSKCLIGIVNDILDLSKIEANRLTLHNSQFNLDAFVETLKSLFIEQANQKNLAFYAAIASDVPKEIIGDQLRLQQVLTNLIGNSVKFTETGSIQLTISKISSTSDKVNLRFRVEDTGIGINRENLTDLFKPFSQINNFANRQNQGSGLGLVISHNLVQLMGGDLDMQSTPAKGTTITIELPFPLPAKEERATERKPGETNKAGDLKADLPKIGPLLNGSHVLVVEDNQVNQLIAKSLLELAGAVVTTANNGQEALDLLDQHPFVAVLMDIHMPVLDGIEATRQIRKQIKYAKLPIIAITAGVLAEEQEKYLAAGVNEFIAKPFDAKQMIAVVNRNIERTRRTEL